MEHFWNGFEKNAVSAGWVLKKTIGGAAQRMGDAAAASGRSMKHNIASLGTKAAPVKRVAGNVPITGSAAAVATPKAPQAGWLSGAKSPAAAPASPAVAASPASKGTFLRNTQAYMKRNPLTTLGAGAGIGAAGMGIMNNNQNNRAQGY